MNAARRLAQTIPARKRSLLGVLVASAALLALGLAPASASAARSYQSQITQANSTDFSHPWGLAVDANDNLWVFDQGASLLSKFDSSGAYQAQNDGTGSWSGSPYIQGLAYGTSADQLYVPDSNFDDIWGVKASDASNAGVDLNNGIGGGCCFIKDAVDNSGTATDGDVYVTDGSKLIRIDGSNAAADFSASQIYISANQITGTPAHSFGGASAVATDAAGDVYVADNANAEVDEFDNTGTFVQAFTGSFGTISALAVDPTNGDVLIGDADNNVVHEFDSSAAFLADLDGTDTPDASMTPQGLAVDSSGVLYVSDSAHPVVDVFSPAGGGGPAPPKLKYAPASNLGPTSATLNANVDPNGGGDVTACHFEYGTDTSYSLGSVTCSPDPSSSNFTVPTDVHADLSGLSAGTTYHYRVLATNATGTKQGSDKTLTTSPAVNLTISDANPIGPGSATLNGHVDSNGGGDISDCHFDYTDDATFQSQGFTGAQSHACTPATPISSATDVSADISGLSAENTYHVRLVATNGIGTATTSDQPFTTTTAVVLSTGAASGITQTGATLNGTLNPGGIPLSSCQFEYTDDDTFQSQGYTGATTVPCDQSLGAIGSGSSDVSVSAAVSGLEAGTFYHFRLKASNTFGTSAGGDQTFASQGPGFGFKSFSFDVTDQNGDPYTQAGGHPYKVEADTVFNTKANAAGHIDPDELVKDLQVSLPPGLVGDPTAVPQCSAALLQSFAASPGDNSNCPPSSQVGVIDVYVVGFSGNDNQLLDRVPVYNLIPQDGVAAQLGFIYQSYVTIIDSGVRSGTDYGIDSGSSNITTFLPVRRIDLRLWGVPADPSHTPERSCDGVGFNFAGQGGGCTSPVAPKPFFTNATSCTGPQTVTARTDSWQHVGSFVTTTDTLPANTGCNQLQFDPSLKARPTTNVADSPSGLSADLNMPQNSDPVQLGTAHLRKAVVTLPEGLVINPSSANGLGSCSASDIGLTSAGGDLPVTFTPDQAQCPDAAKLGTAEVDTPLLDHPITGNVYAAKPFDNPFGSLLAIYVTAKDVQSGVVIKLAGKVTPDPNTGQLVTTFDENPQQPVGDFKLDFFGGAGGALRTPAVCGDYSTTSEMTPWSAPDSGPPATPHDDWSITQGPNGSCATSPDQLPNSPSFDAGSASLIAGAYAPFVMHLRREDGSQQFASLTLTPPPGLLGKLAGTPACTEAQIAQAQGRNNPGQGAVENADPSCPAASQVGTVTVGAGAGPAPYYTTGKVYLAGPYKGAPLSFVIITPATAGPYDLGAVVVRAAIGLDPATAQITATSDPIPSILAGIPLDVRSIALSLDKPNFTLNGTSCDPSAMSGSLLSTLGQSVSLSERFQLAECDSLPFKPKFKVGLKGGTLRNGHPAATIVLNERGGDANLAKAQITLPPSMQLDQSHIKAPCTRPQFAADQCPAASIIGSVTATSPLVDYTLSGPVYLRTGDNPLPDVVLDLHGPASQPVRFDVVNKIDTVNAKLRATSVTLPDAPVTKAVISLAGGGKGLLVNNTNLCKQTNRASILLEGQNGKTADSTPAVSVAGCRKAHKHHKHHHRRHRAH